MPPELDWLEALLFLMKLLQENQFSPPLVTVPDVVTSRTLSVHLAIFVYLHVYMQRLNLG